MANPPGKPTDAKAKEEPLALLQRFTTQASKYVQVVASEALLVADEVGDEMDRELLDATGKSLCAQVQRLCDYAVEQAERLPLQHRRSVDDLVFRTAGIELAEEGARIAKRGMRKFGGKILEWIIKHIRELKKILLAIIHWILGLLNLKMPHWLHDLINIIDEILALLLGRVTALTGGDAEDFAHKSSAGEVRFLSELRGVALLKQASQGISWFENTENQQPGTPQ